MKKSTIFAIILIQIAIVVGAIYAYAILTKNNSHNSENIAEVEIQEINVPTKEINVPQK